LEFAAALAGVVLVSVDPTMTAGGLSYALDRSRTAALFYQEDGQDQEARAVLPSLRPRLRALRATIAFRQWSEFVGRAAERAETVRRVDSQGWLHTGDVATMDEHGHRGRTACATSPPTRHRPSGTTLTTSRSAGPGRSGRMTCGRASSPAA
jgi:long-subunit acyl-CoA synthetase (AMP-forming)